MDIKKVVINGVSYIGTLKTEDKKKEMVLEGAMATRAGVTKKVISEYIKKKNIGELSDITFGGRGVAYSISELTKEEDMYVKMAEVVMSVAKDKALQSVENGLFDDFLGK